MTLSPEAIEAAAHGIDPRFLDAPQLESEPLNTELGLRLLCQVETLNPIRSFKGRGADWFVARRLERASSPPRFVCASAGNFGQGLAYACRARGAALTVFAAERANSLKLERIRALGAELHLAGHDFDAAKTAARAFAAAQGLEFVEDGREVEIGVGAGTIGLELCRDAGPLDGALVPLGNGALLAGVGSYLRAARPQTRLIGVVASRAPAMLESLRARRPVSTERADTIADGVAVRVPVPAALEALYGVTDEVIAISDAALIAAMRAALEHLGLVLEPAGALGLAAAWQLRARFAGRRLATIFTGGNLTNEQRRRWLC